MLFSGGSTVDPASYNHKSAGSGIEAALGLLALLVQVMELTSQLARIRVHLYPEPVFRKTEGFLYGEEGIPLAAPGASGIGDNMKALGGHKVGEPEILPLIVVLSRS